MSVSPPAELEFDERWYLSQNQDVAREVAKGGWKSGLDHYLAHGRNESRLPRSPSDMPRPGDAGVPAEQILVDSYNKHNGAGYLTPSDLSVTLLPIRRVAFIGSCFLESWGFHKRNPSRCTVDLIVANNAGVLPEPPEPTGPDAYDFQVIQIPLRSVVKDAALWHLPHDSVELHESAYQQACDYLSFQLQSRMQWNLSHGMLSFVANFMIPQRNLMGCLFPRFDLRNPEFFIESLNQHLEKLTRNYRNTFVLDVDRISASLGRRYVQDDLIATISHNALLGTPGAVTTRIEPMDPMVSHFEITWPISFRDSLWSEIVAMFRTVRQIDSVKMVVIDLDDTLWNGISGDMEAVDPFMVEGWPLGFAETLCYLKKRGILLAIISKNDEQRIREIWPVIFCGRLRLEDFAAVRINWRSKADNLAEILSGANLLPRSVVFIDDNPVERAAIKHAFPEVRVLGRYPYYLRQTLLWSSETQAVSVTSESSQRTDMVKAQFEREIRRTQLSREEFLRAAAPTVQMIPIISVQHPRFPRAFELINKTNQFNTTGRRWTSEECEAFLQAGGQFHAFEVKDSYTAYGLVGVVVVKDSTIVQWVMSCRVLGYHIEQAVMATIVGAMRDRGTGDIEGCLIQTPVNSPCKDLFATCGFIRSTEADNWVLNSLTLLGSPNHVTVIDRQRASNVDPDQVTAT